MNEGATPAWIKQVMAANQGGWFVPLKLSAEHPLVIDRWHCMHCGDHFFDSQVGLVMPYHDPDDDSWDWMAIHHYCVMIELGFAELGLELVPESPREPREPVRVRYFDDHLEPLPWTECDQRWHTHVGGSQFAYELAQLERIEPIPETIMEDVFPPLPPGQGPDGFGPIEPHHQMYNRYGPNDTDAHEETYYTVRHPEHGLFLLMTVGGFQGLPDRVVWAEIGYDRYIEVAESRGRRHESPPSEPSEYVDDLLDGLLETQDAMEALNDKSHIAPEGTIWVCGACGKTARSLYGDPPHPLGWDESCMVNAARCIESSLVYEDGRVVKADPDPTWEPPKRLSEEEMQAQEDEFLKEIMSPDWEPDLELLAAATEAVQRMGEGE